MRAAQGPHVVGAKKTIAIDPLTGEPRENCARKRARRAPRSPAPREIQAQIWGGSAPRERETPTKRAGRSAGNPRETPGGTGNPETKDAGTSRDPPRGRVNPRAGGADRMGVRRTANGEPESRYGEKSHVGRGAAPWETQRATREFRRAKRGRAALIQGNPATRRGVSERRGVVAHGWNGSIRGAHSRMRSHVATATRKPHGRKERK